MQAKENNGTGQQMHPAPQEEFFTLPNMLTLVRVGSIPLLLALLYIKGPLWSWLAGLVFCASGLTDLLDGWLARRLKKDSRMGRFLDPLADKLLISSMLVMLVSLGRIPAWMAVVIICREIAVTGLRAIAASQGFTLPSDMWGKSKTMIQMVGVFLLIIPPPVAGIDNRLVGLVVMSVALIITAWSGLAYILRFRRQLMGWTSDDSAL